MVAVPAGSVHRDHFFDVIEHNGCAISFSQDSVQVSRDSDHFLEVWPIPDDQSFIHPSFVKRVARRLSIPMEQFTSRDDEQRGFGWSGPRAV